MATSTPVECDTFSLEELVQRLGISLTVGYEMAKRDSLPVPVIRVGRQYRFSRRAYETLMNGQHSERKPNALSN